MFRWPLLERRRVLAVGGALRPKGREWLSQAIERVLTERVPFGMLSAALFALLSELPMIQEEQITDRGGG